MNTELVLNSIKSITDNDHNKVITFKDIFQDLKGVLTEHQVRYACKQLNKRFQIGIIHPCLGMGKNTAKLIYFYDEIGVGYKLFKNKINRGVVDLAKNQKRLYEILETKKNEGYDPVILLGSDKMNKFLDIN